jgi:hypothetical protein
MIMNVTIAALKEWAIVCKALEEGRQVLLLRKGGIMEYRQGFEVKHNNFLLFPTFEHQSEESIQSDYAYNLGTVLRNAPPNGKNKVTSYAMVADVNEINDKTVLRKLEKYHIWNDRYLNVRMNYNSKKPMSVVLLRVYRMNTPLEVDVQPQWSGCKSWISIEFFQNELQQNTLVNTARPVLDDSKFNSIACEIKEVLT